MIFFQGQYRGMVGTAMGIVREEGSLKLWQGVTPALYRHLVYRFGNRYISLKEAKLKCSLHL